MTAFLLAVGTIFVAAAACGSVAARLRLPRVVGEMGAGLVLGQTLLGHAWPHAENYLFGERVLSTLKPLGLLVVLLYVALVGAELDRSVLLERTRGFVGAFQFMNTGGGGSGNSNNSGGSDNSIPVPNPDVFAVRLKPN